jgi:hypothetical protein
VNHRMLRVGVVTLAIAVMWPAAATPQTTRSTPSARETLPRTPWGDPDFQGTWTTDDYIGVPIQRPADLGDTLVLTEEQFQERLRRQRQAQAAAPGGGGADTGPPDHWGENARRPIRQTSFVTAPANGQIPAVTPAAQARTAGRDRGSFGAGPFNTFTDFTNFDRCITRGVIGSILPRPYGNGLDIVQAPGYLVLRHEMIHEARVIRLVDGPRHQRLGDAIRQYMGSSVGWWEGDTLVVETRHFNDRMSIGFNGNGLRHSDAMTHVERFTRVDAETIRWEVVVEDPKTYGAPFRIGLSFTTAPGYQVFEYACHEGNYGLPNILRAARVEEQGSK